MPAPPSGDPEYRDGLLHGPAHKRAAGINPGNRFEDTRLHISGDAIDARHAELMREGFDPEKRVKIPLEIFPDKTRKVIHKVEAASDMPFDWTVNPYRGCEHGCIYCYARSYHEYLGFSCGLDFETKLIAKHDAPDLLKKELASPRWKPEPIVMSAITDIYQPIEHKLRLARQCLEVMAACGQPVSTMTKGALVLRDLDLWSEMAAKNIGRVTVTLVTLDADLANKLEPRAASPGGRLRMIRELSDAGVPVAVNIAPVIPGINDKELPAILEAIADHGAQQARWSFLQLAYQTKEVFLDWLQREMPERAGHVESLIRQSRDGKLYDSQNSRFRGQGAFAKQIGQVFEVYTRRHGLNKRIRPMSRDVFRRPSLNGQMALFEQPDAPRESQAGLFG